MELAICRAISMFVRLLTGSVFLAAIVACVALSASAQEPGNVWAVGTSGTIIKSTDYGESWSFESSGTNYTLYDIDFYGYDDGWIVGDKVTLRTTNGGQSWSKSTHGYILKAVYFINSSTGWAVGTNGTIRKTTNGGSSWSTQSSGTNYTLNDVYFTNSSSGWIVGDKVTLRTTNGGSTWTPQYHGYVLNGVDFYAHPMGNAVGNYGYIFRTLDGDNWTQIPSYTSFNLTGIQFHSPFGWISGDKRMLRSTDSGQSWTIAYIGGLSLMDVHFTKAWGTGWAVGSTGALLKSTDNGLSWTPKSSGTTAALQAVIFAKTAPPPTITTPSPLPDGTVGVYYSTTLEATGGVTPYTWSVTSGTLPSGLSLGSTTGTINGTPTSSGSHNFTVQVKGANGATSTKPFDLTIQAPPPTITTPSPLPDGTVGVYYSTTLTATGGVTPYTWSVTSGTLPSGLSLGSTTGTISGTPTSSGSHNFTVQVKGANGATSTKPFDLTIQPPPAPTITTPSPLPDGNVGVYYSTTLTATGGVTPYTWSVKYGTLPSGLSLNSSSGTISGTPTGGGVYSFTIQVKGGNGASSTKPFDLTIQGPQAPTITTPSPLPKGMVGIPYNVTLTATGGVTPYTWSVTSGTLPSGLSLNSSSGTISGTPTTSGFYNFTVQVKGGNGASSIKPFDMTIQTAEPIITTPSPLPDAKTGVFYSTTLTATGGVTPYTWSVVSGSLPSGLSLGSSSGIISGTAATSGLSHFIVQVKGANELWSTKPFDLTVVWSPTPLASYEDGEFVSWEYDIVSSPIGLGTGDARINNVQGNPKPSLEVVVQAHGDPFSGTNVSLHSFPSDPMATFDPVQLGEVERIEFSVDTYLDVVTESADRGGSFILIQDDVVYKSGFTYYPIWNKDIWKTFEADLSATDFIAYGGMTPNLVSGSPFTLGFTTGILVQPGADGIILVLYDNFKVDLYPPCGQAQVIEYGTGKPGTNGVPTLTSSNPPVAGQIADVTIANGLPGASPVFLFVGLESATIPFDGGILYTTPDLMVGLPPLPPTGTCTLQYPVPADHSLCGLSLYFQVMFVDPGASGKYHSAQTNGLQWIFGD